MPLVDLGPAPRTKEPNLIDLGPVDENLIDLGPANQKQRFMIAGGDIAPMGRRPSQIPNEPVGFVPKTVESWRRGWRAMDIDFLYNDVIDGKITEEQANKAAVDYEKIERESPVEAKNLASKIWYATARMLPGMTRGYVEGAKYGIAAGAGALAAGQVPPFTLAPEEALTVPGAFATGQTVGSLYFWSKQGRGAIYRESRKQGVSHNTAATIASIGGPIYGAIEFSQVDKIIPGVRLIKGRIPKIILGILIRTGHESLEEGEQKVVTELSQTVGKLVDKKIEVADLPDELKQATKKAWQETYQSLGPMAILQLPGGVVSLAGAEKQTEAEQAAQIPSKKDLIRQQEFNQAAEELDAEEEAFDRAMAEMEAEEASHQAEIRAEARPQIAQMPQIAKPPVQIPQMAVEGQPATAEEAQRPIKRPVDMLGEPIIEPAPRPKQGDLGLEFKQGEGEGQDVEITPELASFVEKWVHAVDEDNKYVNSQDVDDIYEGIVDSGEKLTELFNKKTNPSLQIQTAVRQATLGKPLAPAGFTENVTPPPVVSETETGVGGTFEWPAPLKSMWNRMKRPDRRKYAQAYATWQLGGREGAAPNAEQWVLANHEAAGIRSKVKLAIELAGRRKVTAETVQGGITRRHRAKLIEETAVAIQGHDLYQSNEEARKEQLGDIGPGFYYVSPDLATEVFDVIGRPKVGKGTRLQQMFTTDPTAGAKPIDEALQSAKLRYTEGGEMGREGFDIGPGEFAQAVKEAVEGQAGKGVNEKSLIESQAGDPYLRMLGAKLKMLRSGEPADNIDEALTRIGNELGLEPDVYEDLLISEESAAMKQIREAKTDAEKEMLIDKLTRQKVERQNRFEGHQATAEILEANKIADDIEIKDVEGITKAGTESVGFDEVPFETRGVRTGAYLGRAGQEVILLAYGADSKTGYHEGYHALRDRLTKNDIKVLEAKYEGDTEREAREFAEFATGRKDASSNYIRHIWKKLVAVLTRIKNALQGRGFRTADDIFEGIRTGTVRKMPGFTELSRGGQPQFESSADKIKRLGRIQVNFEAEKARLRAKAGMKRTDKGVNRGRMKAVIMDVTPLISTEYAPGESAAVKGLPITGRKPFATKIKDVTPWVSEEWQPEPKLAAKPEGPEGAPMPEAAHLGPRNRRGPVVTDKELTEEIYKANRDRRESLVRVGLSIENLGGSIAKEVRLTFKSIDRVLRDVHPTIKRLLVDMEQRWRMREGQHMEEIRPFMKTTRKMKRGDWLDYDLALKSGDKTKIVEMQAKYPALIEADKQWRQVADDIIELEKQVGLEEDYREWYYHRRVKDLPGLKKYINDSYGESGIMTIFEAALQRRKENAGGRALTPEEEATVLNNTLRGFVGRRVWLSKPGSAKERTLFAFDENINRFYYDSRQAMVMRIADAHAAIASREFFGRETLQLQNLRAEKSRLATRLYKATARIGDKKVEEGDIKKEHISKARIRFEEINKRIEEFKNQSIESSAGNLANELVMKRKIRPEDEAKLQSALEAYFQPARASQILHFVRSTAYITHIGNFISAITNLQDYGWILYRAPMRTLSASLRATIPGLKSRYTMRELGLNDVAYDMDKFGTIQNTVFRGAGWKLLDIKMKEIYADAVFSDYQAKSRKAKNLKPGTDFMDRLQEFFGDDTKGVIEDLQSGRKTERTEKLVFNEVTRKHSLLRSAMTERYLRSNWARYGYILKNFGLRDAQYLLDEAFKDFGKHPARNVRNILWMAFTLTACDVGVRVLRDLLRGRKIELDKAVADAWLNRLFLSRYNINIMRKEGWWKGGVESLYPPAPIELSVRQIPLVGELYYNWYGEGRRKELEKQEKEREKQGW